MAIIRSLEPGEKLAQPRFAHAGLKPIGLQTGACRVTIPVATAASTVIPMRS